jgi:transposase InsO family protein
VGRVAAAGLVHVPPQSLRDIVSIDFLVAPTVRYELLYVFVVLDNHRRHIRHIAVTAHPTAQWTARQLLEAFAFEDGPRYLQRDRSGIFGRQFQRMVRAIGTQELISSPGSPLQNAYVERVIGSIRRECLDHVIVFSERHLTRVLREYVTYYNERRCHQALEFDAPTGRDVQRDGRVVPIPHLGGLHHHYERQAA